MLHGVTAANVGPGAGQFPEIEGSLEYGARVDALQAGALDYAEWRALSRLRMNPVEAGKMLTLNGESVYYYTPGQHLVDLAAGAALKNETTLTSVDENADLASYAAPVEFRAGEYYEGCAEPENLRYRRSFAAADAAETTYGVAYAEAFPVSIAADGYGSVCSPVDLYIPEGTTVYSAEIAGTTLTFTRVEECLPANSAAIVYAPGAETVAFPVAADMVMLMSESPAELRSSYLTLAHEPAEGNAIYAQASGDGSAMTLKRLEPAEGKVTVPAGTFALEMPDAGETLAVDPETPFDVSTTAIAELQAPAAPAEFYDLQGRRVAPGSRGLLLTHGRKLLVR